MSTIQALRAEIQSLTEALAALQGIRQKSKLNTQEAALYLGISRSTLYKHNSNGRITYHKPNGKIIFYEIQDLNEFLESTIIPSDEDLKKLSKQTAKLMKGKSRWCYDKAGNFKTVNPPIIAVAGKYKPKP